MSNLTDKLSARDNSYPALLQRQLTPGMVKFITDLVRHTEPGHPISFIINARSGNLPQDVYEALVNQERLVMRRQVDLAARDVSGEHKNIEKDADRRQFAMLIAHIVAPLAALDPVIHIVVEAGKEIPRPYNKRRQDYAGADANMSPAICAVFEHEKHSAHPDMLVQWFSLKEERAPAQQEPVKVGLTFLAQFGKIGIDQSNVRAGNAQRTNPALSARDNAIFNSTTATMQAINDHMKDVHAAQEQQNLRTAQDAMQTFVYMFIIEREWSERERSNLASAGISMEQVDTDGLALEGQIDLLLHKLEAVDNVKALPVQLATALHTFKEQLTEYKEELKQAEELDAERDAEAEADTKTPITAREKEARNEMTAVPSGPTEPETPQRVIAPSEQPVPADN